MVEVLHTCVVGGAAARANTSKGSTSPKTQGGSQGEVNPLQRAPQKARALPSYFHSKKTRGYLGFSQCCSTLNRTQDSF